MKKLIFIAVAAVMLLSLFACPSAPPVAPPPPPMEPQQQENIPDFVLNPPIAEDAFYGVGYGKKADLSRSLAAAKNSARVDISMQVEVQIQAAITDYYQEAGAEDNSQMIHFYESVSRSITDTKLAGSRVKKQQPMSDGGVWVLIEYSLNQFRDDFVDAVDEFTRNDDAAFAEFKAEEALRFLDEKLNNSPTTSVPME